MEAKFEIKRNELISEYHKEVHPLWLKYHKEIGQAGSRSLQNHLIRQFRRKIRLRLEELFTEIARLKLGRGKAPDRVYR